MAWAENEGERIPGPEFHGKLYVPRADVMEIKNEVNLLREECGLPELAYSTCAAAWKNHPMLAHVRVHRDKRNFQNCPTCVNLRALLRKARKAGDLERVKELQAELRTHRLLQVGRRMNLCAD